MSKHECKHKWLRRSMRWVCALLVAILSTGLLAGCGGGGGGGTSFGSTPTTFVGGDGSGDGGEPVGTRSCSQCHNSSAPTTGVASDATDPSLDSLSTQGPAANYTASVHNDPSFLRDGADYVTCEGCHGNGQQHSGVGPIPLPNPGVSKCGECHKGEYFDLAAFQEASHSNPNGAPGKFFFQEGTGGEQALYMGQPEYKADGSKVSRNEHIEQCSVCHAKLNNAARIEAGNVVDPQVSCNSCHDAHRPVDRVRNYINTRTADGSFEPAPTGVQLNFRPAKQARVERTYGEGGEAKVFTFFEEQDEDGVWVRAQNHFPFRKGGDATQTAAAYGLQKTAGDHLRTSSERLCASCHSRGQWKHMARYGDAQMPDTHNVDIYEQYRNSGHGDPKQAAWKKFSLLGNPTSDASYRPNYPQDMALSDGGKSLGLHSGSDRITSSCGQCHHGQAAVAFMKGTQHSKTLGESVHDAPILWGDSTVTCLTCHDPHKKGEGTTKGVRVPKYMSYNGEFKPENSANGGGNARGGVNKFMDLTPLPANSNSNICLFCHQGRESGYTVWNKIRRVRKNASGDPVYGANFAYDNPNVVIDTSQTKTGGAFVAGSASVTNLSSTTSLYVGQTVSIGTSPLQSSTTVSSIDVATSKVVLSKTASLTGVVTLTFGTAPNQYTRTGNITAGSADVTSVSSTTDLTVGMSVSGASALVSGTTIKSIDGANAITLTNALTLSGTNVSFTFGGFSFANPHYFEGGAILWSRNSFEFKDKQYSNGIPQHQAKNCTGCHMGDVGPDMKEGGHSFAPNVKTCQQCHPVSSTTAVVAHKDYNGNGQVETSHAEFGTITAIPMNTAQAGVYGSGVGGTGLFGRLNEALYELGIRYDPTTNPYFYRWNATGTYSAWTPNQIAAAYNLQQMYKSYAADYHNAYYSAQVLIDSLEALGRTTPQAGNVGTAFQRPTTPAGGTMRLFTDYRALTP